MKDIMSLNRKECIEFATQTTKNATIKYNDALSLAQNSSYGSAIALLILSSEELIKAFILFLDGYGFLFRKHTKGINSILTKSHQLRHVIGFSLSVLYIIGDIFKDFIINLKKHPENIKQYNFNDPKFQRSALKVILSVLNKFHKECIWFSNAEFYRQNGYYSDFIDIPILPQDIPEEKYLEVKLRIDNLRYVFFEIIEILENHSEEIHADIIDIQKQFMDQKFYDKIGETLIFLNKEKKNPFDLISEMLINLTDEFRNKQKL